MKKKMIIFYLDKRNSLSVMKKVVNEKESLKIILLEKLLINTNHIARLMEAFSILGV